MTHETSTPRNRRATHATTRTAIVLAALRCMAPGSSTYTTLRMFLYSDALKAGGGDGNAIIDDYSLGFLMPPKQPDVTTRLPIVVARRPDGDTFGLLNTLPQAASSAIAIVSVDYGYSDTFGFVTGNARLTTYTLEMARVGTVLQGTERLAFDPRELAISDGSAVTASPATKVVQPPPSKQVRLSSLDLTVDRAIVVDGFTFTFDVTKDGLKAQPLVVRVADQTLPNVTLSGIASQRRMASLTIAARGPDGSSVMEWRLSNVAVSDFRQQRKSDGVTEQMSVVFDKLEYVVGTTKSVVLAFKP
jgi:hypothetical protein